MGKSPALKKGISLGAVAKRSGSGTNVSARVQRKLDKKISLINKLTPRSSAMARSAGVNKKKKQKQATTALHNYEGLAETLESIGLPAAPKNGDASRKQLGESVKSIRARQSVGRTETARLQAVLSNSVFRSNPLAAISTHLEATLPPPPPPPRKQLTKTQQRKQKKERARRQAAEDAMN